MADSSIIELFMHQVNSRGDETAALVKRGGQYQPVTWNAMWKQSRSIAAGLLALGIEPGDRGSIISHSTLTWVQCDLGILAAGGVTVPIYPSNLAHEVQYVLEHSDTRVVFAEDATQVAKCRDQKGSLGHVRKIVQLSGEIEGDNSDEWVIHLDRLIEMGGGHESQIEDRIASLSTDSILTIIYTSGTTGRPKGVVLTHGAMCFEAEAIQKIDIIRSSDIQLLFLPLAHVFAKVLEIAWFSVGHVMAFAENMTTIKENLAEVRPTIMCGVPRIFEKFYAAVVEKGTSAGGLKKRLFEAALGLSIKHGEAEERGEALSFIDNLKFRALQRIIFSKIGEGIMQTLGGRMRLMVSGGAPLSKKIGWFFRDADISVVEGYGLTETCAGTCVNRASHNQIGTVGPAVPGMQLKIAEDGEVLVKGPAMLREYWKDEQATAESIQDGWFHTGDIGELDEKTHALRITDRKKDLIVTAGGKNVAPQKLENLLKNHKLISQAVVFGDRRKYLTTIVTLEPEQLKTLANAQGLSGSYSELTKKPEIERAVSAIIDDVNHELASYESLKKFRILDHDFSIEDGQLTPKLSVKRKVVNSRYGDIFDSMYDSTDR